MGTLGTNKAIARLRQLIAKSRLDELPAIIGVLVELEESARLRLREIPLARPVGMPGAPARTAGTVRGGARHEALPPPRKGGIIREAERARLTGISQTAWWHAERRGEVPKRRKIGPRMVGWLESEILDWILSREAGLLPPPAEAVEAWKRR
jgi:prophage regulatory protein